MSLGCKSTSARPNLTGKFLGWMETCILSLLYANWCKLYIIKSCKWNHFKHHPSYSVERNSGVPWYRRIPFLSLYTFTVSTRRRGSLRPWICFHCKTPRSKSLTTGELLHARCRLGVRASYKAIHQEVRVTLGSAVHKNQISYLCMGDSCFNMAIYKL